MGIHTVLTAESAAPAEFAAARAMLEPFVGARLNRARNELGYMIERTNFVDIFAPGVAFIDADVRAVSADGVTICRFGGFSETIAFDDIDLIRVRREGCRDEVLNLRRAA